MIKAPIEMAFDQIKINGGHLAVMMSCLLWLVHTLFSLCAIFFTAVLVKVLLNILSIYFPRSVYLMTSC